MMRNYSPQKALFIAIFTLIAIGSFKQITNRDEKHPVKVFVEKCLNGFASGGKTVATIAAVMATITCLVFGMGMPSGSACILAALLGAIRRELEQVGFGFEKEVSSLVLAKEKGFFTMAYCYNPEEAGILADIMTFSEAIQGSFGNTIFALFLEP